MAKTFLESINTKDPNFLKEYEGKYISAPEGMYKVSGGVVTPFDLEAENQKWLASKGMKKGEYGSGAFVQGISSGASVFDTAGGLQPAGKSSYQTSEAFRYFNSNAVPYAQSSTNFGMGASSSFRPRGANEDMTSYLREKQAWEASQGLAPTINQGGAIMNAGQASPEQISGAGTPTSSTTRLPSGVLVRDKSNGRIFFIDNGTKRYITNPNIITGKDIVDVDSSHLINVPDGANINTAPTGWDFPTGGTGINKMNEVGINWTEPAGFNPNLPGSGVSGGQVSTEANSLANDPEYQSLPEDLRAILDTFNEAINANTAEDAQAAQEALTQATEIVDPWIQVMIGFAMDSIPDEFKITKQTIEEKIQTSQERLTQIGKLITDSGLEEQQALGTIAKDYENKITDMQDQVSGAGLTYSSKRSDLESFIKQQNMDLVQSTQRSAGQRIRSLEQSKREAERQEKLLRDAGNATLENLARAGEQLVGTEAFTGLGLTNLSGSAIQPIGGQSGIPTAGGSIDQQRINMIINLSSQIRQNNNPSALNSLFNL